MARLNGESVLIVEDELIVAMVLEDMLMELGAGAVRSAANVPDALRFAQSEKFDLAIVDIDLNGKRSTEVVDALRAQKVPIIFATGYDEGAAEGALVLRKPYTQADIIKAVEALKL